MQGLDSVYITWMVVRREDSKKTLNLCTYKYTGTLYESKRMEGSYYSNDSGKKVEKVHTYMLQ